MLDDVRSFLRLTDAVNLNLMDIRERVVDSIEVEKIVSRVLSWSQVDERVIVGGVVSEVLIDGLLLYF